MEVSAEINQIKMKKKLQRSMKLKDFFFPFQWIYIEYLLFAKYIQRYIEKSIKIVNLKNKIN